MRIGNPGWYRSRNNWVIWLTMAVGGNLRSGMSERRREWTV
ncbi:MAG: hypothetical protein OXE96_12670 [Gemmatimonadetes bacterium]|nr:hypothetical protein [Gemmatimonadota bacterium]